ncbi:MAG: DNA polymerase III subunit gamma and tau [Candidatus Nanopelagicaceae bacterium]|nr:DNA polymerase III subunit gamma and tau [Candidatus Nanopelagicaceae bacterium]
MSLALYRKYRPSTFSEVVGQEQVTEPLMNALSNDRIHHAYLFSGPRGCGKTSSARIMARSLNCEKGPTPNPCGECQSCRDLVANGPGSLDVIELDAATHGLVDDARDLRDKAFFAPVNSKYKIYIIDEAHQLGPGAANALLKVVEEPPPHVIFIFATTEPDKLISTIRSRTHHYPFRLVPPGVLGTLLDKNCKDEGVKVAKGVIPLVVRASGGSVRDAQSILGQLLAGAGKEGVTYEIAVQLLGYTDGALLDDAIDALAARDGATLFTTVDRVIESGHDPRRFASDLLERLRDLMIVDALGETNPAAILREIPDDQLERMRAQAKHIGSAGLSRSADIAAEGLTQMRGATAPRLMLELICARMLLPIGDASESGMLSRIERLERAESISIPVRPASANTAETKEKAVSAHVSEAAPKQPEKSTAPKANKPSAPTNHTFDVSGLRRLWPDVIEDVKKKRRLTWSLLSASAQIIAVDDKIITIGIVNAGARDSFLRSNSDEILRQAFIDVVGIDRKIEAIIDPSVDGTPQAKGGPTKGESLDDPQAPSGLSLLASELGAEVIKVEEHD